MLSRFQGKLKIHEDIGNKLAEHVLPLATQNLKSSEENSAFNFIAGRLAMRILGEKSDLCRALHAIVDGPLDADRLDYVPRDIAMTGFGGANLQYDRLFNSFRLVYEEPPYNWPMFLPSIQALGSIEEFLQRRYNLYAFVIYHHRVVKTDGLLREVVRGLAEEYLSAREQDADISNNAITLDISGLWQTIDLDRNLHPEQSADRYIQWDDAWLLTVLRRHYFLKRGQEAAGSGLLMVQLEELLSNKKYYHSLYKRPDSFLLLDDAFISALGRNFSFSPLEARAAEIAVVGETDIKELGIGHQLEMVSKYHSQWFGEEGDKEEDLRASRAQWRERNGFFVVIILDLLDTLGEGGANQMDFIRKAAEDLVLDQNLTDVFLVPKTLKTGVDQEKKLRLINDEKIVDLREVSQVLGELERRSKNFPRFFVYVYGDGVLGDRITVIRTRFAELMAERFRELLGKISPLGGKNDDSRVDSGAERAGRV